MKKILKFISILLFLGILFIASYYLMYNEALPSGEQNEKAEALAQKMLKAINYKAFESTEVITWSFRDQHHYVWRKSEGKVEVSWDDKKVLLNLQDPSQSTVYVKEEFTENPKLIEKALAYFNNDSFWVVAPYKIMDPGTERRLVKYEGKEALLVTYTSGGTTPGDSYLWIVDDQGMPVSFKMWVKIIPIGGVAASWDDTFISDSGILVPNTHTLSLFGLSIPITNLKAYNPKADAFAQKMLSALNYEAYKNTRYLEWSFRGARFFKWDKQQNYVEVQWGDTKVGLYTQDTSKSVILQKDAKETSTDEALIARAVRIFNNDSFWLVAPYKLFEPGIYRSMTQIDGKDALHVYYSTGGSTPGDSYTWLVDENFLPVQYFMYVPSMNMKGLASTWEGWTPVSTGALLPKTHFIGTSELNMGDVKGYN